MLSQVQIHPEPNASTKEKGDFFENILRHVMEAQRYRITQRINFTGTEIDLLCEHRDRPTETAIVECKAKAVVTADDVKNFCFDVIVRKRAKVGFFVHTTELQHQAAGLARELEEQYAGTLLFWGPEKVLELLQHEKLISNVPEHLPSTSITPTKRILMYTHLGRYWVTLYSNQIVPTHYRAIDASEPKTPVPETVKRWLKGLDELRNLQPLSTDPHNPVPRIPVHFDAVAEIQEADEWDDYRPVGKKYFIGREDIRGSIYQFIQSPLTKANTRRVFFIEGKSGWGKSSLLAELRARCENRRNKNTLRVFAADSRGANTSEFVTLAFAKMIACAAKAGFIPANFSEVNLVSPLDLLVSDRVKELFRWLEDQGRVLILIFDQFEDVFRKDDLFRAFHKLMLDVHEAQTNLVVGFSWKSEIYIPIDNQAYGLWQQAKGFAESFVVEEFLGYEVDRVIGQLQDLSGHQLPADLKRRLRDLQRFPWLIKKLAIHCFRQMKKGISPEALADQNLNVEDLFRSDTEGLSPAESRALNLIAKKGYEGQPFDVGEIDETIQESEVNALLSKRLIVRSGGKYNVYWDNFRDYLIEGRPPLVAESFLLRQFPAPCISMLEFLLANSPCTLEKIMEVSPTFAGRNEGTALNHIRELRYLGVVKKVGDDYVLRSSIQSMSDFDRYLRERMNSHVVVRRLEKLTKDLIGVEDVQAALVDNYKGYEFSDKTWLTYARYLIAWLRHAGIDFGRRLSNQSSRRRGTDSFTPQRLPEPDLEVLREVLVAPDGVVRDRYNDKSLYDLKTFGLVDYENKKAVLTKRGTLLRGQSDNNVRRQLAEIALSLPKTAAAYRATVAVGSDSSDRFEKFESMAAVLDAITSPTYRKVTMSVLRGWGKFLVAELGA